MKTFQFIQKNSGIIVIISANSFEEAEVILFNTVKDNYGWRVNNEEGEE
jgi:hypothetical protein